LQAVVDRCATRHVSTTLVELAPTVTRQGFFPKHWNVPNWSPLGTTFTRLPACAETNRMGRHCEKALWKVGSIRFRTYPTMIDIDFDQTCWELSDFPWLSTLVRLLFFPLSSIFPSAYRRSNRTSRLIFKDCYGTYRSPPNQTH